MNLAGGFGGEIWLQHDNKRANAKDILNVMVLGVTFGSILIVEAEGEDAESALDALAALINDRFGEAE